MRGLPEPIVPDESGLPVEARKCKIEQHAALKLHLEHVENRGQLNLSRPQRAFQWFHLAAACDDAVRERPQLGLFCRHPSFRIPVPYHHGNLCA